MRGFDGYMPSMKGRRRSVCARAGLHHRQVTHVANLAGAARKGIMLVP